MLLYCIVPYYDIHYCNIIPYRDPSVSVVFWAPNLGAPAGRRSTSWEEVLRAQGQVRGLLA